MDATMTLKHADEKADKIVRGMVQQIAALALIPAAINWAFIAGLMSIGAVRIGRTYGYKFDKNEGWHLIREFFKAAGITFLGLSVGLKMITAVIQATGVGYLPVLAMDIVLSAAIAYAVGMGAKQYFRQGRNMSGVGGVIRDSFKQARRDFSKDNLAAIRKRDKLKPYNAKALVRILKTKNGQDALNYSLIDNPDVLNLLTEFLKRNGGLQLDQMTSDHLKVLDDESGLAHEIWDLLQEEFDIKKLQMKENSLVSKQPARFKSKVATALSPLLLSMNTNPVHAQEILSQSVKALTDNIQQMSHEQIHTVMESAFYIYGDETNPFIALSWRQSEELFLEDISRITNHASDHGLLESSLQEMIQVSLEFDHSWIQQLSDAVDQSYADTLFEAFA